MSGQIKVQESDGCNVNSPEEARRDESDEWEFNDSDNGDMDNGIDDDEDDDDNPNEDADEAGQRKKPPFGVEYSNLDDIKAKIIAIKQVGFGFICTPLLDPVFHSDRQFRGIYPVTQAFTCSDMSLSSRDWTTRVVGVVSDYDFEVTASSNTRSRDIQGFNAELGYYTHLQLPAFLVKHPLQKCDVLARMVYSHTVQAKNSAFWIQFPLMTSKDRCVGTWNLWNSFRDACHQNRRIYPVLSLSANLPGENEIQRWLGEQVRCIFVPTSIFVTNLKGFPTLPRYHKRVLQYFFHFDVQVCIVPSMNDVDVTNEKKCLDRIWKNHLKLSPPLNSMYAEYDDFLQAPLQPLMDNLESTTYEVFEKDPVKYDLYERAIELALGDLKTNVKDEIVVMVVGAGRGPLVSRVFKAAKKSVVKVRVYAIEKNINAVNTLFHVNKSRWNDRVHIVCTDMRHWVAPEKADLIVSELLGSFGDNELSPECLDGVTMFLKDTGIMIPMEYSSFAAPIMAPKVWNEIKASRRNDRPQYAHFDMAYVVNLKTHYEIAPPKLLFTFNHPLKRQDKFGPVNNDREGQLKFSAKVDCVVHGFSGYFEARLYGNVMLSIHPDTHSEKMFSWFPCYFPVREPIFVKKNDDLVVNFWRCSNRTAVWYEWNVSSPIVSPLQNINGKSYKIGL